MSYEHYALSTEVKFEAKGSRYLALPPSALVRRWVSLESRYGTWPLPPGPSLSLLITTPSCVRGGGGVGGAVGR